MTSLKPVSRKNQINSAMYYLSVQSQKGAKKNPMNRGQRFWGRICLTAFAAVLTCSVHAQSDGRWTGPDQVYSHLCSACHDHGVGPTIKGLGLPPSMTIKTVREGQDAMPAFRPSEIDDATLAALAKSLRESKSPRSAP